MCVWRRAARSRAIRSRAITPGVHQLLLQTRATPRANSPRRLGVSPSVAISVHVQGVRIAWRGSGKGNDLRDHPTATDHVERFTCCHPVEVVRSAVTELPQADCLPHPVTFDYQHCYSGMSREFGLAQPRQPSSSSLPAAGLAQNLSHIKLDVQSSEGPISVKAHPGDRPPA
jgi:hypothetical protein